MDPTGRRPAPAHTQPLPRPRMLACDIDGTLLDERSELRPAVRDAIGRIAASGVEVFLATGRSPWTGVEVIAGELGLTGPQVTMQGALVSLPGTGEVLRLCELPPAIYTGALRFAEQHRLEPIVSLVDGHLAGHGLGRDAFGHTPVEGPTFRRVDDLGSVAHDRPMRVYLPVDRGRFPALLEAAIAHAGEDASVVWSDGSGFEFLAPGTHKGSAVAWLAEQRGLTMADVAAVGDAPNDRELLSMAGRSAAMGGAPPDVVACADIAVPPSSETGVLEAFAWFFPDLADQLLGERAPRTLEQEVTR